MVTMTGGMGTEIVTAVLQYSMTGDHVALPSLTIGRYAHACGHFTNSNGAIVSEDKVLAIITLIDQFSIALKTVRKS